MFRNKNLSVPIVDDCRLTRRFYEMHIKKFGVKVQADENGKQAVDLFRSGTSFNLNIKDQDMPVMDGLEATKQLRGMGVNCRIDGVTSISSQDESSLAKCKVSWCR
ncbi:hypothetical protein ES319_D13G196600v1 [Gossypium barbadense]|uniref:Response regulatory domain-containing protein n=2 Tax=Gossypium TaxID=3633 RepID=A0A5J5NNR6_GOSBA|nr:hypothetical protein ES319_D13G196600v1 [Gossypium barbadense]TYG38276.1 hypothetical protein ES288_D13G208700v1 [Gossypium darwinii]